MRAFLLPFVIVIPLLLSACSSTHGPGSGKYFQNDGPPSSEEADGPDAQPRVEPFKSGTLKPYRVLGKTYVPITEDVPFSQTGTGSWYGKQFHGKKTATGEIYNMFAMTAAHPTLPLPSYAEVTNLDNGRKIIVRVNDRGPFINSRVIDLSYAAAKRIGYANKGTGHVRVRRLTFSEIRSGRYDSTQTPAVSTSTAAVTPIENEPVRVSPVSPSARGEPVPAVSTSTPAAEPVMPDSPTGNWGVQVGFFSEKDNAQAFLAHSEATLSSMGDQLSTRIVKENNGYRVIIGRYASSDTARTAAQAIGNNLGVSAFPIQR